MRSSTGIKWLAGLLVGGLLAALSASTLGEVAQGSKAAGLENCVAPTADIRRNHMDYLKHDRNETVQRGVRDIQYSLAECVDCHAAKGPKGDYLPVNGEGQFCQGCHDYVAVGLACFQCHRKTPEAGASNMHSSSVPSTGRWPKSLGLLLEGNETPALSAEELDRLHAIVVED